MQINALQGRGAQNKLEHYRDFLQGGIPSERKTAV